MKWKVSTNKKLFDWKQARDKFEQQGSYILNQSKGKSIMKMVPHEGDEVVIVCDKKEVLVGVVLGEFKEGISHQDGVCDFSQGGNDNHRLVSCFASIKIIALGNLSENRGCQRTWTSYKKRV